MNPVVLGPTNFLWPKIYSSESRKNLPSSPTARATHGILQVTTEDLTESEPSLEPSSDPSSELSSELDSDDSLLESLLELLRDELDEDEDCFERFLVWRFLVFWRFMSFLPFEDEPTRPLSSLLMSSFTFAFLNSSTPRLLRKRGSTYAQHSHGSRLLLAAAF